MSKKQQRWNYGKKGVFKRKLKSGYSWCYWYYDEEGILKKVTVPNASSREDAIVTMEARVRKVFNRVHGLERRSITFREFAPVYLEKYAKPKKDSWKTDEGYINGRLVPYFGDMLLSEITPEHVSEFVTQFTPIHKNVKEIKGSTINKHLQVLSRMMNIAEEFGYDFGKNPVRRKIHFAKETKYRRTRVLTHEEEERLMAEAAPHLRPVIQCALLQAMRLKEILQLRISDIDLDSGTITIRPENNKTGNLDIIPLRPKMRPVIERLAAENGGRSPFVFNYEDPETGELRPVVTCQRSFRTAQQRAKIEGLEFRDLRRTCSTRLHESGTDPLIISRLLRHSSAKISTEVYIQSSMKMMQRALAEVDGKAEFPHVLEHNWNTKVQNSIKTKDGQRVRCLFSTN